MSAARNECVIFPTDDLLPGAWREIAATGPVRAFNPGLLRDGDGWILACRIVLPDGLRRIAIGRLDRGLKMIAGSAAPLSDQVRFAAGGDYPAIVTHWFADPRLYRFGGRVFIYWNSGWHEPRNWQFLQELDPVTLQPIGSPRELVLRGERQKLEKNWTFFEEPGTGRLLALYSILPHRVLEFSLADEGDIAFGEVARIDWSLEAYPLSHGGLRGGAPPVLADDRFWVFCHSVHDGADGYRYALAAYCFAPRAPFSPVAQPTRLLDLAHPPGGGRAFARLNPAVGEVAYPCGAARDGNRWLISHGINDERCAIAICPVAQVAATLMPVAVRAELNSPPRTG